MLGEKRNVMPGKKKQHKCSRQVRGQCEGVVKKARRPKELGVGGGGGVWWGCMWGQWGNMVLGGKAKSGKRKATKRGG